MFSSYEKNQDPQRAITFGDGNQGLVKGLGKIAISPDHSISNVFLVDSLDYNLLSVSQLCKMGYNCLFTDIGVTVFRRSDDSIAFKGVLEGQLYLVDFDRAELDTCLIAKTNMGWLWHRRLAHVGMKNLHKLLKGEHILGLTNVHFEKDRICSACQAGKQVGVHHIEGHVSANYIEHPDLEPPFMCLIVSGGHTHLVIVKDYGEFEILGRTRDDAAGEAFDKVARAIGLGYPGGPKIDKVSKEGNPDAIVFPKAKLEDPYDFSFSGVKSAVLNHINRCKMQGEEICEADIAASFQKAVVDTLVEKAVKAAKEHHMDKLAIAGGVASNSALRQAMKEACEREHIQFYYPSPIFCTDNAAMIGVAAYYEYKKGVRHGWDLNAVPNLKLGER